MYVFVKNSKNPYKVLKIVQIICLKMCIFHFYANFMQQQNNDEINMNKNLNLYLGALNIGEN